MPNFERLSALFELGAERSAVALVTAAGLAVLPTLAGELARRYGLHPVDLTCDGDPYADLTRLPRARVLVGLSLLSPTRMQECLGRLNRGRDRIHALGLHIVLVIDDRDLRSVHALAPDFASRVHELLHFELEHHQPSGPLVLSPLGPLRRPNPEQAPPSEDILTLAWRAGRLPARSWRRGRRALRSRAVRGQRGPRRGRDEAYAAVASVAWRLAIAEQTWVAWIDMGVWDRLPVTLWLFEMGGPRLTVLLSPTPTDIPTRLAEKVTMIFSYSVKDGESTPPTKREWIDLCP